MKQLREYVTERNATTFLRPDLVTTTAELASDALYNAIAALDRLRKHPGNAGQDGACVRLRELGVKLVAIKDELDLAIEQAEAQIDLP